MNGEFFLSLMRNTFRGTRLRIYPLPAHEVKCYVYSCKNGGSECFEVTEPFEGTLDSFNDVAIRLITDGGICLIIYVKDLSVTLGLGKL